MTKNQHVGTTTLASLLDAAQAPAAPRAQQRRSSKGRKAKQELESAAALQIPSSLLRILSCIAPEHSLSPDHAARLIVYIRHFAGGSDGQPTRAANLRKRAEGLVDDRPKSIEQKIKGVELAKALLYRAAQAAEIHVPLLALDPEVQDSRLYALSEVEQAEEQLLRHLIGIGLDRAKDTSDLPLEQILGVIFEAAQEVKETYQIHEGKSVDLVMAATTLGLLKKARQAQWASKTHTTENLQRALGFLFMVKKRLVEALNREPTIEEMVEVAKTMKAQYSEELLRAAWKTSQVGSVDSLNRILEEAGREAGEEGLGIDDGFEEAYDPYTDDRLAYFGASRGINSIGRRLWDGKTEEGRVYNLGVRLLQADAYGLLACQLEDELGRRATDSEYQAAILYVEAMTRPDKEEMDDAWAATRGRPGELYDPAKLRNFESPRMRIRATRLDLDQSEGYLSA